MKKYKEEVIPGNWEYDQRGRKFRRVGNNIEYAAKVLTSSGEIYEDELQAHNEWMREQSKRILKERQAAAREAHTGRSCPFKVMKGGMHTACQKDCAFYRSEACSFSDMKEPAAVDTKGVFCPIVGRPCREDCGMYNSGCTLI